METRPNRAYTAAVEHIAEPTALEGGRVKAAKSGPGARLSEPPAGCFPQIRFAQSRLGESRSRSGQRPRNHCLVFEQWSVPTTPEWKPQNWATAQRGRNMRKEIVSPIAPLAMAALLTQGCRSSDPFTTWTTRPIPDNLPVHGPARPGAIRVIVLGEVYNPGIYHLAGKPTVKDAISAAGGLTEWAVWRFSRVIRDRRKEILFEGKRRIAVERIELGAGDQIYISRTY